jgi:hypothetical protein
VVTSHSMWAKGELWTGNLDSAASVQQRPHPGSQHFDLDHLTTGLVVVDRHQREPSSQPGSSCHSDSCDIVIASRRPRRWHPIVIS